MHLRHLLTLTSVIAFSLGSLGCKKPTSRLKTLENFASGKDVRVNACTAPADQLDRKDPRNKVAVFIDVGDTQFAKKLSVELILALSAVPDAAFKIFQAKNGKVLVTPDASKICNFKGALKFNGVSPVAKSCLVYTPFGTTSKKFLKAMEGATLVIVPDATAIRHGVVRSMGYMLADTLDKDTGFSALRVELTKAFISDMATSTVFSLKSHENLLGSEIDSIVRSNIARNRSNILEGARTDSAKVYNFMQLVIGEAFDSYYCRTGGTALFDKGVAERIKTPKDAPLFNYLTDTRLVMSYFFPRTFSVFKLVEAHMEGFASKLPELQFRNGRSDFESSGGFSLAGESSATAYSLTDNEVQSVSQRISDLEGMVRQNAILTRESHEQFQQKKTNYDSSWSDVWGTKKSEMDAAKAAYNYAQSREQALLKELQSVREEEKRYGSFSNTSSNDSFQTPNLKVETFDFNKELEKGVQDVAKTYGEKSGQALGAVGQAVGGDVGKAAGEGLGDGIGGVLGAFGKNTTDGISGFGKKITDTQQFVNDLAVDPTGTMMKQGREYIDGGIKRLESVQGFGKELITLDTTALGKRADGFVSNTTGIGTLYNTTKNVYNYATATSPEQLQAAIQAQYNTAGNSISELQAAVTQSALTEIKESNLIKPVVDRVTASMDYAQHQVKGMIVQGAGSYLDPSGSKYEKMKAGSGAFKMVKDSYENVNTAITAISENALPTEAIEGLTTGLSDYLKPNKRPAESSDTVIKTLQPTMTPLDSSSFDATSPMPAKQYNYAPSFAQATTTGALTPISNSNATTSDAHVKFWQDRDQGVGGNFGD
jgi:hypothetical protein